MAELRKLIEAIARDPAQAARILKTAPALATERWPKGVGELFLEPISHYVYAGDTALHVASAAHNTALVKSLLDAGADVSTVNRRGATPLHYACDGGPMIEGWDAGAQAKTIAALCKAGADVNAPDKSGVCPLHRAVRTRCSAAVNALLKAGADPKRKNGKGSTPLKLAQLTTGRGGSGTPEAKREQAAILKLLG